MRLPCSNSIICLIRILSQMYVIPVNALTGANINERAEFLATAESRVAGAPRDDVGESWYSHGASLLETLESFGSTSLPFDHARKQQHEGKASEPFRMMVMVSLCFNTCES